MKRNAIVKMAKMAKLGGISTTMCHVIIMVQNNVGDLNNVNLGIQILQTDYAISMFVNAIQQLVMQQQVLPVPQITCKNAQHVIMDINGM